MMGSTLGIRVISRNGGLLGLASVLAALASVAAPGAATAMVGVAVETVPTAKVGDVVPLDISIGVQKGLFPDDGILDLELSTGLRPVRFPRGCEFDGVAWRVRCDLPDATERGWEIHRRVDVLVTLEGRAFARANLTVPGEDPFAWGSGGLDATTPDTVRRYAPQFRFSRFENHWPESVETLLVDSSLMYAWDRCPDDTVVPTGQVTTDRLGMPGGGDPIAWPEDGVRLCGAGSDAHDTIDNTRPGGQDQFYSRAAIPGSKEGFYLAIGRTGQTGSAPSEGATTYDSVPVYYQYRAPDPKLGDGYIRYWVLYGCSLSATIGDPSLSGVREGDCWHEGDWEGVAVRLDRDTGTATDIAYFAHEEDADIRVFAPDGPDPFVDPVVEVLAGDGETVATHPVVYVGAGSHSSRTGAGDHEACQTFGDRVVCGTDQTADDLRWDSWNDLRSAEDSWFGFGGAWGAVGPIPAALGVHGPGGPGLVDPLPKQWSDKDVPRCRAGEIHPESAGTGTSCDVGDGSGTGEAAVPGEPTGVVVKAGRARVNESVTWPVTVSWDPVEEGTRVAVYLTAADPAGQFGRPTTCDDALTRLRKWADKNPDGGEPRYPNVLLATSDPGAGSVRYTGGGATDYNGQPCAIYVRAIGDHGASALVEARGRFEP